MAPDMAQFRTLSVDLAPVANRALRHFRDHGHTVVAEKKLDLGYPYTPTLVCRRQQTTLVLEVVERLDRARMVEWLGYGKSAGHDFRVGVCVSDAAEQHITPEDRTWLAQKGVGLFAAGAAIVERSAARDLALNLALPDLARESRRVRELLSPPFEQIGGPDWRDGFLTACETFENLARTYLRQGIRSTRIQVMGAQGIRNPSIPTINRMTMGQLAKTFRSIQSQNHLDAQIAEALQRLNPDRVRATHRRRHGATERRLRANVGRHMYAIFGVIRQIV